MVDGNRLTVEYWPVDRILPYAANARTHPEAQVAQLVESMREFGFTQPCLVDADGCLVAGHGRLLAAAQLGLAEAPVIRLGHLTEAQVRAYRLADNRIALNSEWDEELLAQELAAISEDYDLASLGFSDAELDALLDFEGAPPAGPQDGEDETPEPPAVAAAQAGDVWLLGQHRLVCGDSTNKAAVEACLAGETPHLMVTDPPYGVEYDPSWRDGVDLNLGKGPGKANSGRSLGVVLNDERADWRETWALFPGEVAYVWHGGLHSGVVADSLVVVGFEIRTQIIWAKQLQVFGRGHYHWKHEPCWYAVKKGGSGHWQGDRKQNTVWDIKNNNPLGGGGEEKTIHSTQKPVECMRRPIVNNSAPGDAVYDPFLGSGTTLIAAETEGRRCFGLELNPPYVDVIIKRWQDLTGKDAVLEATQQTFAAVTAERLAVREAAE